MVWQELNPSVAALNRYCPSWGPLLRGAFELGDADRPCGLALFSLLPKGSPDGERHTGVTRTAASWSTPPWRVLPSFVRPPGRGRPSTAHLVSFDESWVDGDDSSRLEAFRVARRPASWIHGPPLDAAGFDRHHDRYWMKRAILEIAQRDRALARDFHAVAHETEALLLRLMGINALQGLTYVYGCFLNYQRTEGYSSFLVLLLQRLQALYVTARLSSASHDEALDSALHRLVGEHEYDKKRRRWLLVIKDLTCRNHYGDIGEASELLDELVDKASSASCWPWGGDGAALELVPRDDRQVVHLLLRRTLLNPVSPLLRYDKRDAYMRWRKAFVGWSQERKKQISMLIVRRMAGFTLAEQRRVSELDELVFHLLHYSMEGQGSPKDIQLLSRSLASSFGHDPVRLAALLDRELLPAAARRLGPWFELVEQGLRNVRDVLDRDRVLARKRQAHKEDRG